MAEKTKTDGASFLSNNSFSSALGIDEASKALAPAIKTLSNLMDAFLGPPASSGGAFFGEVVTGWRINHHLKLLQGVKEKCEKAGVDPHSLPKSLLLPGLDACKDVDDPGLQQMWQRLLANAAANESDRQIMFIETLKLLSPNDANVFDGFANLGPNAVASAALDNPNRQTFPRLESVRLVEVIITARQQDKYGSIGREIVRIKDVRGREHETFLSPPIIGATPDSINVYRPGWRLSEFGAATPQSCDDRPDN